MTPKPNRRYPISTLYIIVLATIVGDLRAQNGGAEAFNLSPDKRAVGSQFEITVTNADAACDPAEQQLADATLVAPRGSGLTVSDNTVRNGCMLTAMVSIAPDGPVDDVILRVEREEAVVGTATFSVTNIPPGPIPPGLEPKVDAMWKVLPRQVTSDSFGRRIAKHYYGINVHIGNNSGYPLQLSTIGFEFNLDSGKKCLGEDCRRLPSDGYRDVRATLEKEQEIGFRHWILSSLKTVGLIMTGTVPFYKNAGPADHFKNYVTVVNGPLVQGFALLVPDLTVNQLLRLDNQTLRDGLIVPNNTQFYTKVFFSKHFLDLKAADRDDAKKVMKALGHLVIVGQKIQFLERVRVLAKPEGGPVTPPPTVTGVNPTTFASGAENVATIITGAFLQDLDITAPPGFTISDIRREQHGNGVAFSLTVGDLDAGRYSLLITTPGGSQPASIQVINPSTVTIGEDVAEGAAGVEYEAALTASGGLEPYQWELLDSDTDTLPDELALAQNGDWSGIPPAAGEFSFTVRATDASAASGQATLSLTVNLSVTQPDLPDGTVDAAYPEVQLEAVGGTVENYAWAGEAPGLGVNEQGVISGTPTTEGTFNFTVTVTDSETGSTGTRELTVTVGPAG